MLKSADTKSAVGEKRSRRRGLGKTRVAVVLAESPTVHRLLLRDGTVEEVPDSEFAKWRLEPQSNDTGSGSPAFRLLQTTETPDEDWDKDALEKAALEFAKTGADEARRFGQAVAQHGATEWLRAVNELPLSSSERAWLGMHTHARAGDQTAALASALRLPIDGYPDKLPVMLAGAISGGPATEIARHVEPFAGSDDVAALTTAVVNPKVLTTSDDWLRATRALADLLQERKRKKKKHDESPGNALLALATACAGGATRQRLPHGHLGDAAFSLRVALALRGNSDMPTLAPARALDPVVADELIDRGEQGPLPEDSADAYLIARRAPETLSDLQFDQLGFPEEAARRAFARSNDRHLASLAGKHPDNDVVIRFAALGRLRHGDLNAAREVDELLENSPERQQALLLENYFRSGELDPELLEDSTVWPALMQTLSPEQVPASAGPAGAGYKAWAGLMDTKAALHEWTWGAAAERARDVLRDSNVEAVRDEALNLLAYAQYQQGNPDAAIAALEKALEGNYTSALQANIGVVAESLAPEVAAEHLGRLANEAPSLRLQLAAAMRALKLWTLTRSPWEEQEEDDVLPANLRGALRRLAVADTTFEEHEEILGTLAQFDARWLADSANTTTSPHSRAPLHKVHVARAQGTEEYVRVLAAELRADQESSGLRQERDSFVVALRELMFDDEPHLGGAHFADMLLTERMPLDAWDEVVLGAGSVWVFAGSIDPDEGTPSPELFQSLLRAAERSRDLPAEEAQRVSALLTQAAETYAAILHDGLLEGFRHVEDAGNSIAAELATLRPWKRVNHDAVYEATDPMLAFLGDADARMAEVIDYLDDREIVEALNRLRESAYELQVWLHDIRRGNGGAGAWRAEPETYEPHRRASQTTKEQQARATCPVCGKSLVTANARDQHLAAKHNKA